jgi:hypothetical protein
VAFINDKNFVFELGGREFDAFAQFADVIDAAMACRVDFNQINGPTARYFQTIGASVARFGFVRFAVETVYGFGDDARRGGFAAPARPGKQICVGDMSAFDFVLDRNRYMILTRHIRERLRPVFAI